MKPAALLLAAALALPLAACKEDTAAAPPAPVEMTDEAIGHYCQMYLADHGGPKAQIHFAGHDAPLWFSQVSDAAAFVRDPERFAEIRAIYVSDMAVAESWAEPGRGHWIAADAAHFVIESRQKGGMGIPEAIPFGTLPAAEAFVAAEGGRILGFDAIPEAYLRPAMPQDTEEEDQG